LQPHFCNSSWTFGSWVLGLFCNIMLIFIYLKDKNNLKYLKLTK
jgi:hypothetical protein